MPNRDSPMGFRPAIGIGRQHSFQLFPIDSANGTAVFVGDMVSLVAAGAVNPAAANDGTIVAGVVVALYDANFIPVGAYASSTTTKHLAASTAGYALVAKALAGAIFIGQSQTGQTPAATSIGATTDHVAGAGNTTTGISGHELNMSDLNNGGQVRILSLVREPSNSWAEHADIYFEFNESAFMGSGAATGV